MALLSLALLFSLPALSYAEPIHIQLSGRAPVAHDLDFYKSAAEHLRGKYGISRRSIRRATSSSISITNQVSAISRTSYSPHLTFPSEYRLELFCTGKHWYTVSSLSSMGYATMWYSTAVRFLLNIERRTVTQARAGTTVSRHSCATASIKFPVFVR